MVFIRSAVSGDVLATWESDELEGKSITALKSKLAQEIGVSRFRQRWFAEDGELEENTEITSDVQLVVLNFLPVENGHSRQLISACETNSLDELEALLQQPLMPDASDEIGCTAVFTAAEHGHSQCLSLLFEAGAAVDRRALYVAARQGHSKIVQMLLENGAAKEKSKLHGAFVVAAEFGKSEVATLLLAAGADAEAIIAEGAQTALHLAAEGGYVDTVRLLLEARADTNTAAGSGETPLHAAVWDSQLEIVRLLLEAKADTNKGRVDCGATALHFAAVQGELEIFTLLLQAKADPNLPVYPRWDAEYDNPFDRGESFEQVSLGSFY